MILRDMKLFASKVGIAFDRNITAAQLEKCLNMAAKSVQRANKALRQGKTILYDNVPYRISFIGTIQNEFKVKLTPVASRLGSTRWVSIFNLTEVSEVIVEDKTPQRNGLMAV